MASTLSAGLVTPVSVTSVDLVAFEPNEKPPNAGAAVEFDAAKVLFGEPNVMELLGLELTAAVFDELPNWNDAVPLVGLPNEAEPKTDGFGAAADSGLASDGFVPNVNDVLAVGLPKTNDDLGSSDVDLTAADGSFGVSQHTHLATVDSFLVMHA